MRSDVTDYLGGLVWVAFGNGVHLVDVGGLRGGLDRGGQSRRLCCSHSEAERGRLRAGLCYEHHVLHVRVGVVVVVGVASKESGVDSFHGATHERGVGRPVYAVKPSDLFSSQSGWDERINNCGEPFGSPLI